MPQSHTEKKNCWFEYVNSMTNEGPYYFYQHFVKNDYLWKRYYDYWLHAKKLEDEIMDSNRGKSACDLKSWMIWWSRNGISNDLDRVLHCLKHTDPSWLKVVGCKNKRSTLKGREFSTFYLTISVTDHLWNYNLQQWWNSLFRWRPITPSSS